MDREQFDELARLFATPGSRRAALGVLLGTVLGVPLAATEAARRKGTRRRQEARAGKGSANGKAKRSARDKGKNARRHARNRRTQPAGAEAIRCCSTGNCTPGKGKNLQKCCYQGQNLTGKNFSGANLGEANFSRATLTGANVQGANLGKACFVDAVLTGFKTNASTNWDGAVLCRTRTDAGEDHSGCGRGTPCCPTCDDRHPCGDDEVCCNGRCIRGNCCDTGQPSSCDDGQVCCGNTCVAGECCQAADCPNETCQRRACRDNQCVYTPVTGEPGPRCQTACCQDDGGEPVCCTGATATCDSQGRCCTPETKDQTCGVGTASPKCGEITNTCGTRIDCGRCAEKTCQVSNCRGQTNTCIYESIIGGPGAGCQTVCCRNEAGEPVCCDAGVSICLPSGRCGCGRDADCGTDEKCCAGNCIARWRCCEGGSSEGCGGELHCCNIAGDGICQECCEFGHCSPGDTCQGGSCQPATTFERVRAIVVAYFGIDESTITMETDFARDLNLDSLDMVELVLAVEQEFDIVISDEDVENIRTMADAVRAIDERRG